MDAATPTHHDGPTSPGTIVPNRAADYAALLASAERVLDDVDRVLAALDEGTYGHCTSCGQRIGDRVMAADPLASGCDAHRAGAAATPLVGRAAVRAPEPG